MIRLSSHRFRPNDPITWPRAWSGAELSRRRGRTLLVEALEPRQLLSLTVTAAGQAAGFGLSTFASGFPEQSGHVGPWGMAFPASGGVLVSDAVGNVRLFPSDTDGQNAATVPTVSGALAPSSPAGMARLGANVYLMMSGPNQVAQLNDDGTVKKVVATVPSPLGVAANPLDGHLFVSTFDSKIYDVNPVTGSVSDILDTPVDGLAFNPGAGILYFATIGRVRGFNITTKAVVFDSGTIAGGPDGVALGTGPVAGNLFVNTNGGTVVEVNLATSAQTIIASGGSRGDFVTVDPNNGTLLVTQSDRIMRLVPGVFVIPPYHLTTTTALDLTPETSTFGQAVTLRAVVATAATGIPNGTVTFTIDGQAQAPVSLIEVGGSDQATFTTSTLMPGTHTINAAYSGDPTFASSDSNPASVTIIPGASTGPTAATRTALTAQPRPANLGRPVTLTATVKDHQRRGPTPVGSVTFLDGTVNLGTAVLRRGKASLKISSLPLGRDTILADYTPAQGFATSTGTVVEDVRAQRSRSKAALSAQTGRSYPVDGLDSGASGSGDHRRRPNPTRSIEP